jgi:hypothetical protein
MDSAGGQEPVKSLNSFRGLPLSILVAALVLLASVPGHAQRGGRGGAAPAANARTSAPVDLTGYWVSVISEDWEFRMVTPDKGVFDTLTLNNEGRRVGQQWDPAKDVAAGEQCKAYGAANIMRMPTRLNITWENDTTLKINTDAGTQSRLLRFGTPAPADTQPSWQGYSVAEWEMAPGARGGARGGGAAAPRAGNLKVVTTHLRPGYVRRNGAPYSDRAVVTEYYDAYTLPNGDQWFTVTTKVEDPVYFSRPLITTSEFKKLPDNAGWNPSPCAAG